MSKNKDSHHSAKASYDGQYFDRSLHAAFSRIIGPLSPASFRLAWLDWYIHLAICPAKLFNIADQAMKKSLKLFSYIEECELHEQPEPCIVCRDEDHRFSKPAWKEFPYNIYSQWFVLLEQIWEESTQDIPGIDKHHRHFVEFFGRQILDFYSPSNWPWTNPDVIERTIADQGQNLVRGFHNAVEDIMRYNDGMPPVGADQFKAGVNVAITPGKVIYRNRLMELIQYSPTTSEVYAEPILMVPAWIMKYYILDLSDHNSMVKYLVEQGHTVFMISWKNPDRKDRNLDLNDYVNLGIMSALSMINAIIPNQKVHAMGYCLGGTLLMMAAAAMAGKHDARFKTISLFAAQIDFEDAGEIMLFVDESQVTYIEDIMWEKGYLDGAQMGGAFSMLHSSDLIWSRMVINYLLGERRPLNDLMAWDADTTRMPYKMHSQYLRSLFLNNDLVQGRFIVDGKNVLLPDVEEPMFVVSTVTDHVAPWKSVYKIHYFTDTDVTFVLTNGGHNAGIVSEPGHRNRSFKMLSHIDTHQHLTPEQWQESAPEYKGSWWPEWSKWLISHSSGKTKIPSMGDPKQAHPTLEDAPGTYVLVK